MHAWSYWLGWNLFIEQSRMLQAMRFMAAYKTRKCHVSFKISENAGIVSCSACSQYRKHYGPVDHEAYIRLSRGSFGCSRLS